MSWQPRLIGHSRPNKKRWPALEEQYLSDFWLVYPHAPGIPHLHTYDYAHTPAYIHTRVTLEVRTQLTLKAGQKGEGKNRHRSLVSLLLRALVCPVCGAQDLGFAYPVFHLLQHPWRMTHWPTGGGTTRSVNAIRTQMSDEREGTQVTSMFNELCCLGWAPSWLPRPAKEVCILLCKIISRDEL